MINKRLAAVVIAGLLILVGAVAAAPSTQPVTPAGSAPALTGDDQLLLNGVAMLADLANAACSALPVSQRYMSQRQQVQRRFELLYPGYTVDWTSAPARLVARRK